MTRSLVSFPFRSFPCVVCSLADLSVGVLFAAVALEYAQHISCCFC
jgi:hypothetical protein